MPSVFDKGFSKLTIDVATSMVVMLFADEIHIRVRNFGSHRLYLNAILGRGSGASIALLFLLTLLQVLACAVITFPVLYKNMGTALPSMALGATLIFELILYHGYSDWELVLKALFVELSLALIGLLRGDERIRQDALGTPLIGSAIAVEAKLRTFCTAAHAALFCPPMCVLLALRCFVYHRYWNLSGAAFELHRTSFCTNVALCSLLLFAAGQDRSPSKHVASKLCDVVESGFMYAYKPAFKLYYGHNPNGKKKRL